MPTVTASAFSAQADLYRSIARHEPVIVTTDGREEVVLIAAEAYRRLTRRRRRPYLIEDLPDADWRAIEEAFAALPPDEGQG